MLDLDRHTPIHAALDHRELCPSSLKRSLECELTWYAFDAVRAVQVLDQSHLEASGTALARDDGGISKEILPDAIPPFSIFRLDLVLIANPVAVPSPQSGRIVHADGVKGLDLEPGTFKLVNHEAQRRRSIGTGKDVFVHEQAPDQVLVLPCFPETSVLEEENTIIVKHVVHLCQEASEMSNTNVLCHFQARDAFVAPLGHGNVTVVHAENVALGLGNSRLAKTVIPPGGLVSTQSDSSDVSTIIHTGIFGQRSPATADVEELVTRLHADLLANDGELVVLEFFEGFLPVDIRDDAGRVDHAGTQEPAVEIVTTIVVVTYLFLVLGSGMHDGFGDKAGEEEFH